MEKDDFIEKEERHQNENKTKMTDNKRKHKNNRNARKNFKTALAGNSKNLIEL